MLHQDWPRYDAPDPGLSVAWYIARLDLGLWIGVPDIVCLDLSFWISVPDIARLDLGLWLSVTDIPPRGLLWTMPAAGSCSTCRTFLRMLPF